MDACDGVAIVNLFRTFRIARAETTGFESPSAAHWCQTPLPRLNVRRRSDWCLTPIGPAQGAARSSDLDFTRDKTPKLLEMARSAASALPARSSGPHRCASRRRCRFCGRTGSRRPRGWRTPGGIGTLAGRRGQPGCSRPGSRRCCSPPDRGRWAQASFLNHGATRGHLVLNRSGVGGCHPGDSLAGGGRVGWLVRHPRLLQPSPLSSLSRPGAIPAEPSLPRTLPSERSIAGAAQSSRRGVHPAPAVRRRGSRR